MLRDSLMKGLRKFATRPVDDAIAKRLLACVTCDRGRPERPRLVRRHERAARASWRQARETGGNRLFYLATPPNAFAPISRELGRTGMLKENGAWRRLVVEKPFGTDLASAQALNERAAEARRRAPDLPDRSLSRQGDRPEHPGAALCQRHVRADLESQPHRSHPDHRRREARRRPSRQFLRRHRRAARHGAEPSVPAAVAGGDGAAGRIRCACGALGKGRSARGDPDPERGGSAAEFGARPISWRGKIGDTEIERLSQDRGCRARTAPPKPMPR